GAAGASISSRSCVPRDPGSLPADTHRRPLDVLALSTKKRGTPIACLYYLLITFVPYPLYGRTSGAVLRQPPQRLNYRIYLIFRGGIAHANTGGAVGIGADGLMG